MKRAAVAMAILAMAASAFAADGNEAANSKIAKSTPNGVSLPNADAPSAPVPVSEAPAAMIIPVKPATAAKSQHGFVPMLHSAFIPEHTSVRQQREWIAFSMMAHGAAAFDAYTTRVSLESGRGYERNPLMRPFASSAAVYPAAQVLPFGLDYLSRRMMRSNNTVLRHTWFIPQLASTVGSTWVGVRNLNVAQ